MAITRDIAERQIVTPNALIWLERQMPNTILILEESNRAIKTLVLTDKRLEENLPRHDRRGKVASYREAIELRICAWPSSNDARSTAELLKERNIAAMDTLALASRIYSR